MSGAPLTVTALALPTRWYACPDCDVSWHSTDQVCWSCERNVSVLAAPPHIKKGDAFEATFVPVGVLDVLLDALLDPTPVPGMATDAVADINPPTTSRWSSQS